MTTMIMISDNDKTWPFENLISREIICLTPIAIGACQHGNLQNLLRDDAIENKYNSIFIRARLDIAPRSEL